MASAVTTTKYSVSGIIYDEFNHPLNKIIAKLFDVDFRSEIPLGEKVTDEKGFYEISFQGRLAATPEYKTPDLRIKIFDARALLLGQSPIYFNVSAKTVIDYKIGGTVNTGLNEFDRLILLTKPIIEPAELALGQLQENEIYQDISFLAGELDESQEKIAHLNSAFGIGISTKLAADIFYALLRTGFPVNLDVILMSSAESVKASLLRAIETNIISSKWSDKIDEVIRQLNNLTTKKVSSDLQGEGTNLKKTLGLALSPDQQNIFLDTFFANESTPEKFWENLKQQQGITEEQLEKTQHALRLSLLTDFQPELTNQLFKEEDAFKDLRGFSAFTQADWKERIIKAGVQHFPSIVSGNSYEENLENYAGILSVSLQQLYPTSVLAAGLSRDGNSFGDMKPLLLKFFFNNPDFNLSTNNTTEEFKKSDFREIPEDKKTALQTELKSISRLYKISGEFNTLAALHADKTESATSLIHKYSRKSFTTKFGEQFGRDTADRIYSNARELDNKSTAIALSHQKKNDLPVYVMDGNNHRLSPDYQSLFGDNNLCHCDHCQSVYSPAAYLVDILNFIRLNSPEAYAALDRRRPDIKQILLTCENTNTPLPYIDLVNEILEDRVAPPNPGVWRQTTLTAAELSAYPEYTNTEAYDILANASSSLQLPLHLPLEQTRLYLEKLGVKRHELMELFSGNGIADQYSNIHIAREYLRLSSQEAALLSTSPPVDMNMVTDFLHTTSISYMELLQLLECYFINPAIDSEQRQITITGPETNPATCNINELKISGATDATKARIWPFLRLWKKTGWTMIDLDQTLMAFQAVQLSADVIIKVSHVARIKTKYNLDVPAALALWTNIGTRKYNDQTKENHPPIESLYNRLFQNKKTKNPVDENFGDPSDLSGLLRDIDPGVTPPLDNPATITASLSLTQKDLQSWVALTDGNLNLHNLSILYRYSALARLLQLSAKDLLTIVSLTSIDPFIEPVGTGLIFAFIEKAELIRSSGFSTQELKELITVVPDGAEPVEERQRLRLSRLLKVLKITTEEYVYFQDETNAVKLQISHIWGIPTATIFGAFENLLYLIRFRDLVKGGSDWYKIFNFTTQSEFTASFIALTKMSQADVDYLLTKFSFSFPADFYSGKKLMQLAICGAMGARTGSTAQQLESLTVQDITAELSNLAMSLLRSRYDENAWLEVIKPLSNQLRISRRDALSAHLIDTSTDFSATDDLFHQFLIDTEIAVCMKTSRIKQAISSMQLFMDRCLLNLEEGIELDTSIATQWHAWRKMYRVWEANRKIFLYPENWVEPGLRDNKTTLFTELESKLQQSEVTDTMAKEALLGYLEKLDAIAQLEVVAIFADASTEITHVIARTPSAPHDFYYRYQQQHVWSNWEKLDIDIEGDHILLTVWNNRVIALWGLFTEKQEEIPFVTPGTGQTLAEPGKYFEMKLAWSENKNGKWKKKKISKEVISFPVNMQIVQISFDSFIKSGELWITAFGSYPPDRQYINSLGLYSYIFDGCHAEPKIRRHAFGNSPYFTTLLTVHPESMLLGEKPSNNDITLDVFNTGFFRTNNSQTTRLFNNTPGRFKVLPEHQEIGTKENVHFFYSNEKQVFYARSTGGFRLPDITIELSGSMVLMRNAFTPANVGIAMPFDGVVPVTVSLPTILRGKKYIFQSFYHPYVCDFTRVLNAEGIDGLYKEEMQSREEITLFTTTNYQPTVAVRTPYPVEKMDFDITGPYATHNWELFFHIPLLIATQLSKNQQFSEAQQWFHYIFNPTKSTDDPAEGVERFWITLPFKQEILNGVKSIEQILNDVDSGELNAQLNIWHNDPFNPHAIARLRISAYMRTTVMKYIDNLIAWGDQLFQRDTLESINEATLLYILASNTLGRRPTIIPARAVPEVNSFETVKDKLDAFSNAKVEIQSYISPSGEPGAGLDSTPLMPLFCLPSNDKLLGYWDIVADRLFKIRNCMNIQGVVRQLPLFEPPIDPALLVKAAAAGLDLATVLSDIAVELPSYRFHVMLQRANELCNDVKNFGANLLSVMEKRDAEQLTLLRSSHETKLVQLTKDLKIAMVDEAKENLGNLEKQREGIEFRREFYLNRPYTNSAEKEYLQKSKIALISQEVQQLGDLAAGLLFKVPSGHMGAWSWGVTTGGQHYGAAASAIARAAGAVAGYYTHEATMANVRGTFDRRQDEWTFLAKAAELELNPVNKQIAASEIRLAIAEKDLENHELQMENSQEVDDYLSGKFTNADVYDYMTGQLSTVYFQSYQLAYQTAKKAEKCLQHELGIAGTNYIQFGYWDSLKKGLMSGEKLQYDLRRLEDAYLDGNKREYEVVKHISLVNLDPLAIVSLRATGSCQIEIPEVIFDMDHPGQYFRRLKSVSLSIPCIAGPYTSISAKLSLQNSRYRKNTVTTPSYEEVPGTDERFIYFNGPVQSISTSNAQNDSGIFELNFRDERYLPFEGSGAINSWDLELPAAIRQFDYNTITDVIMHVKYTAREGGNEFKAQVNGSVADRLEEIAQQLGEQGMHVLINMKHDLSNEWNLLKKNGAVNLKIDKYRLPYLAQTLDTTIKNVLFVGKMKNDEAGFSVSVNDTVLPVTAIEDWDLFQASITDIQLDTAFSISVPQNVEELMMVIKYRF